MRSFEEIRRSNARFFKEQTIGLKLPTIKKSLLFES